MVYRTVITIFATLFLLSISSCIHQQTCDEAKTTFTGLEFGMVLNRWELKGNYFDLYGKNLKKLTENVEFHNYSLRCFDLIIDKFHKNDIIIKKKGEDFIKIYHGKDHFKFTYVCEEKYGEEITKFVQERF